MVNLEFEIVENTVKEILQKTDGKLTDIAFYHDADENRYLIVHNFFDRLFSDDNFAQIVSTILYEGLDKQGISHYDFFADDEALAMLTMNFESEVSVGKKFETTLSFSIEDENPTVFYSNSTRLDELDKNLLLSA